MISIDSQKLSDWKNRILAADPQALDMRVPPQDFLIASETVGRRTFNEFYIPFTGINEKARIIIAGLTPGFTQWQNAVAAAKDAIHRGLSDDEVLAAAKLTGAFSGPMRTLLIAELDSVGFHAAAGVSSSAVFFEEPGNVHMTSVFTHPIFANGKGLNTVGNLLERSELLRSSLRNGFAKEAAVLPNAFIFPLGKAATECCEWLIKAGELNADRVFPGLQHPSPANRARIDYFCGRKRREEMSGANKPEPIDRDKAAFIAAMKRCFG